MWQEGNTQMWILTDDPASSAGELMKDMKGCFLFLLVLLNRSERQIGTHRSSATVNSHVKGKKTVKTV